MPPLYRPATTAAALPAPRLWTEVPAAALEPALLPRSRRPALAALASGAAASQTASAGCGQSPARRGRTGALLMRPLFEPTTQYARSCGGGVVTQQEFFVLPLCDRPGCHEPPLQSGCRQARYCCPACRQAVRRVLDRERQWQLRSTFQGRRARAQESKAARARPCAAH